MKNRGHYDTCMDREKEVTNENHWNERSRKLNQYPTPNLVFKDTHAYNFH
jgi:hypothetical protein